ncbi:MarR family transcriptional regulator [Nitrosopumilus sp.]|uniref:helix-turn-helix transcriptional regulator n=1 Tax=Nitrosopumilus sp. TaxID=2024843 RepID=UPI00292D7C79|nr:MarR family transcriptional regulator [Nitrosopumilus sp.]
MNAEIVSIHRKEFIREDGMLFVRNDGILETMVKAPLILAGLIVVALAIPIQTSFSSTRTLDLTIYSDGSAHVSSQLDVDPINPTFEANLFGPSIDNFIAVDENGVGLYHEINGELVTITTFDSSSITINYDIHDLISKEGRVWTFSFDSPTDFSLLMPPNSIIVGINALPLNMELENDQTKLELSTGVSEINYIFGTTNPGEPTTNPGEPTTNPGEPTTNPGEPTTNPGEPTDDLTIFAIIGIPIVAIAATAIIIMKRKQIRSSAILHNEPTSNSTTNDDLLDTKTIFNLRPEMREDDKEIVKFISANGGQALESDLRKKFLQPRTTMWRAVKRLERQGVIEISKKDLQNLVKLKKELEEED